MKSTICHRCCSLIFWSILWLPVGFSQNFFNPSGSAKETKNSPPPDADLVDATNQKIANFTRFVEVIASKTIDDTQRRRAVQKAIELFIQKATIEVSNKKRNTIIPYPIATYLHNLMSIRAAVVVLEFITVSMLDASDFKMVEENGRKYYTAVANVKQVFKCKKNADSQKWDYYDVTDKNIEIVVEILQTSNNKERYIVRLGDISVEETN